MEGREKDTTIIYLAMRLLLQHFISLREEVDNYTLRIILNVFS